ncbi:hypothetical protein GCM10022199_02600 [Marihabitans asiaticum]|uniref:TfoX-like protein n=1 Tax=Marihabitans asiaticum TaxID=415218 RepID=A0A560WEX3_9MICO|nr:TfoX/Sxy family protein [Marihabitans asiaticum]TWD16064.1 TfoX-like protein [Marihabitans asiaticum]
MAYDEGLAARVRELLRGETDLTERKMFGGLGFMLEGHMAVAAGSRRSLMVRVPEDADVDPLLRPMEMRGRVTSGWFETDPDRELNDAELERLVRPSVAFVRTLPAKVRG